MEPPEDEERDGYYSELSLRSNENPGHTEREGVRDCWPLSVPADETFLNVWRKSV